MTRKLLVATDGSPSATQAVRLLAGYRGDRAQLEVTLLSVQPWAPDLFPEGDPALREALAAGSRPHVDAAAALLAPSGITAVRKAAVGVPVKTILEEAHSQDADAILMGTRGLGGLGALFLGSVSSRVAQQSSVPVILVKADARLPRDLGRQARVLVAADGSTPSLNAAAHAAGWGDWLGDVRADIVNVQPSLTVLSAILPPHDDVVRHWGGHAAEEATRGVRAVFEANGLPYELHLAQGEPAERIAALAAELQSDFVFMGTRGLGAVHHAFIGSVALKVAQLADVPVVLVP